MIFALLLLFLFLSDDEPNLKVMKKFFAVLFLASGLLSFTSCSEDPDGPEPGMIWDIAPFVINITVSDKDGNDLLNPETSLSIANNGIKAIFGGETFEMDSMPVADGQSRAILAVFRGLYSYQGSDGRYRLSFGEFAGDRNYDPQELGIDWKNDTLDKGDHLNLSGAHKVTDYMTMYLQEHYMLPDHRGDEKFTSWDTMASQYTTETGY